MFRKAILVSMTAVIGVASVIMLSSAGCSKDNPTSHQASEIIGNWAGVTSVVSGAIHPDTFAICLNFPDAANYTLTRGKVKYASSASPMVDSMREIGTWTINGDNVVLTEAVCLHMQSWQSTWAEADTINCSSIPQTNTIPIAISNNQWTFDMVEWGNGDTISYTVSK